MSFGKPLIHSSIEMNGREKASTAFCPGFDDRLRGLLTSERPSFAIVLFVSIVDADVRHSIAGKLVLTALPLMVIFSLVQSTSNQCRLCINADLALTKRSPDGSSGFSRIVTLVTRAQPSVLDMSPVPKRWPTKKQLLNCLHSSFRRSLLPFPFP